VPEIDLDAFLALALRLADAAGAEIRPYFRRPLVVDDKPDLTPVTAADRAAEAVMRALIEVHHRFGRAVGSGHRGQIGFVVDDERPAEIRANLGAGRIGQAQRKSEKGVEIDFRHRPILAFRGRR